MAKPLLPDALWSIIEPLLPKHTPSPKGGRPRLDDRKALTGILFILRTGMAWEDLPTELNCGCGMSCWRRLDEWQRDGTWDRIHAVLLHKLDAAGKIDWSKAAIDSSSVRAVFGGSIPGRTPQIAVKTAANIISLWTVAASRWPAKSAPPTSPISPC
jgi:transposase